MASSKIQKTVFTSNELYYVLPIPPKEHISWDESEV